MSDETPVLVQQQRLVERLASWLASAVESKPGWNARILELKPHGAAMLMRITEHAGGGESAQAGQLEPGSGPYEDAWELRSLCAISAQESWNSMSIHVVASGWPDPRFSLDVYYNFDEPSPDFGLGENPDSGGATVSQTTEPNPGLDNTLVFEALETFSAQPNGRTAINVARQILGTELLLDISENPDQPGISVVEVQGVPSVLAFTSHAELVEFRRTTKRGSAATSWVVAGGQLLRFVADHREIEALRINPAGPTCTLAQSDIQFVVGSLANSGLKTATMASDTVKSVLQALRQPDAMVILADRSGGDGLAGPLVLPGPNGRSVLPVFSSGAEVAAFDPTLKFSQVSAEWVLDTALQSTGYDVVVNPAGPPVYMGRDQMAHPE